MISFLLNWVVFFLIDSAGSEGLRAFRLNGTLPNKRVWMSASFDGIDSIYLFGGFGPSGRVNEILRYSISSDQIEVVAKLPRAIFSGTVARYVDGEIFYMGGWDQKQGYSEIMKFSPSTGRVEKSTTVLPLPNHSGCAVKLNDNSDMAYIFGGDADTTGIIQFEMRSLKTERVGSLPQEYFGASCFSDNNGSAFLFGKTHPALKINLTTLDIEYGQRPLPGTSFSSAVWDGDLFGYIIGGDPSYGHQGDTIIQFNQIIMDHAFIHVSDFLAKVTPPQSYGMSSVYVPSRDRIYIFGGEVANVSLDGIWYIDLSPVVKPTTIFTSNTSGIGSVICSNKTATVSWIGSSEKCSLEAYINNASVPSFELVNTNNHTIQMSIPHAHYEFKLVVGSQDNWLSLGVCTTEAERPYKNPTDVRTSSWKQYYLDVTWSPVNYTDQNGNWFGYSVKWKMEQDEEWRIEQPVSVISITPW